MQIWHNTAGSGQRDPPGLVLEVGGGTQLYKVIYLCTDLSVGYPDTHI